MNAKLMGSCPLEPPRQVRLQVNTDLRLLPQVLAWFDQFRQSNLPHATWLQCQLALAEGFTNAVRHAHGGQPAETPVEIEVTTRSQSIELRIWDRGLGFDLDRLLGSQPPKIDESAESGRGLNIIKQTADTFSYTRTTDHRNCLHIIKNYLPAAVRPLNDVMERSFEF